MRADGLPDLEGLEVSQQQVDQAQADELARLEALQRQVEEQAANEKAAEAAYLQKKTDNTEPIELRQQLISEAKEVDHKIKKARADNIEEMIVNFERLDRETEDRQNDLAEVGNVLLGKREYLGRVSALAEGKEVVSPDVQDAINNVQAQIAELEAREQQLSTQIERDTSPHPSRERIAEYRQMLQKMSDLTKQIEEISANPDVIEVLMHEAKSENAIRGEVVDAVDEKLNSNEVRLTQEGLELYRQLTQKFLDVVFRRFGAEDTDQQRELTSGMLEGLNKHNIWDGDFMKRPGLEQRWQGVILANLLSRYGNPSLDKLWQYQELGEYGQKIKPEDAQALVREYYPVYNHLIAMRKGTTNPGAESGLLAYMGDDRSITMPNHNLSLHQMGFGYNPGGQPLVPEDASEEEKAAIQKEFDRIVAETQVAEEQLVGRLRNGLTTERDKLLAKQERFTVLVKLNEEVDRIKRSHRQVMLDRNIRPDQNSADLLQDCQTAVTNLEAGLPGLESHVEELEAGRKRLIGKRAKTDHQANVEKNIATMRGDIEELRSVAEEFQEIEQRRQNLEPLDPSTKELDELGVSRRLAEIARGLENLESNKTNR